MEQKKVNKKIQREKRENKKSFEYLFKCQDNLYLAERNLETLLSLRAQIRQRKPKLKINPKIANRPFTNNENGIFTKFRAYFKFKKFLDEKGAIDEIIGYLCDITEVGNRIHNCKMKINQLNHKIKKYEKRENAEETDNKKGVKKSKSIK